MKKYLAFCTIISLLAACQSGKSTDDSKNVIHPDSFNIPAQDSITNETNKDPVTTDLDYIGELALGQGQLSILEKIGAPEKKSKTEEWGADGLFHQDWEYPSKGIILNMNSDKENGDMTVFSITISSPCQFKTKKNIGIGNTYNEVKTAYEKEIDKEASDKNIITVGSLYGGLIIEFKNEKVVKIFSGAAAE